MRPNVHSECKFHRSVPTELIKSDLWLTHGADTLDPVLPCMNRQVGRSAEQCKSDYILTSGGYGIPPNLIVPPFVSDVPSD